MSIAGGMDRAVVRAAALGCRALQVFTKSSSQWRARPLGEEEVRRFRDGLREAGIRRVVAHNAYLINLASPDDGLWRRSIDGMVEELRRCERLEIPWLICHPGAHMGRGIESGLARIARGVDRVHRRTRGCASGIALENAAGQGSTLGSNFAEIAGVLDRVQEPERMGVCVDTCHLFAAGHDLGTREKWDAAWGTLQDTIGLERLVAIHVNDSVRERGSRVDRHASLGEGAMGLEPFLFLVNEPRLQGVPLILETPKGDDGAEDRRNLAILRDLVGRRRLPRRRSA
jgi:deoxyribonuclease-4